VDRHRHDGTPAQNLKGRAGSTAGAAKGGSRIAKLLRAAKNRMHGLSSGPDAEKHSII